MQQVYRDSAYPSFPHASPPTPSSPPPRRHPTGTPLNTPNEGVTHTASEPDTIQLSTVIKVNQPGSISMATAGTVPPSSSKEDSSVGVSDSDDLVQLFTEDKIDAPTRAATGTASGLGEGSPRKPVKSSIGGKVKNRHDHRSIEYSRTEKLLEKSRRGYGSRVKDNKGKGCESSEWSPRSCHQRHEKEKTKTVRKSVDHKERERGSYSRRTSSSRSPKDKQSLRGYHDDSIGRGSNKDRGKGKLGSSECDYRKNKHGKSIKYINSSSSSSPILISSDSEYEGDHLHRHYHHHQHHHHHHHKLKKNRHHKKSHSHNHRDLDRKMPETDPLPTKEELLQESKAIEEEISNSKKEILKSSLRKERIELLHRTVHGNALSGIGLTGSSGSREGKQLSKLELESQLTELERDIVKEKQELLKVMCRLEKQEHSDSD